MQEIRKNIETSVNIKHIREKANSGFCELLIYTKNGNVLHLQKMNELLPFYIVHYIQTNI